MWVVKAGAMSAVCWYVNTDEDEKGENENYAQILNDEREDEEHQMKIEQTLKISFRTVMVVIKHSTTELLILL